MADLRRVVIEIRPYTTRGTPATSTPNNPSGQEDTDATNTEYLLHPMKNTNKELVAKKRLVAYAGTKALSVITNSLSTSTNRYFALKENYLAETTYRNVLSGISKTSSFASSIIGGATIGGALGVGGATVGAVIGAIGWGANEIVSGISTYSNAMIELGNSIYQTNFSQERYGLINGGRGTDN